MKLLLDENLPVAIRHELVGHDVFTVDYMRWKGTRNGKLLSIAASSGFDALVTIDDAIPKQQNVKNIPLSVIVLVALSNDIDDLRPLVPRLLDALKSLPPRSVIEVK
jgi:hypothetical protein